jgi:hypothetical protein
MRDFFKPRKRRIRPEEVQPTTTKVMALRQLVHSIVNKN